MSTIKSSTEHLTLNADGAGKEIKFQANGVEKASISSAGAFTSTSIDATKLSGALPAIDGSALTAIDGDLVATNGSNANGVWHKFADGTLICTAGGYLYDQNLGYSAGNFYYSEAQTWTFPVSFNSNPKVMANPSGGHWNAVNARAASIGTSSCTYKTLSINSTGNEQGIDLIAIGTWA